MFEFLLILHFNDFYALDIITLDISIRIFAITLLIPPWYKTSSLPSFFSMPFISNLDDVCLCRLLRQWRFHKMLSNHHGWLGSLNVGTVSMIIIHIFFGFVWCFEHTERTWQINNIDIDISNILNSKELSLSYAIQRIFWKSYSRNCGCGQVSNVSKKTWWLQLTMPPGWWKYEIISIDAGC